MTVKRKTTSLIISSFQKSDIPLKLLLPPQVLQNIRKSHIMGSLDQNRTSIRYQLLPLCKKLLQQRVLVRIM